MTFYYKMRQTPNVDSFNVTTSPTQPSQAVNKGYLDTTLTGYVKTDLTNFNKPMTAKFSATPPASPLNGDLWMNTNNGRLYVYYNDGDSSQWIQPAQNTLAVNSAAINNGAANSLSYYSEAGAVLTSTGTNLTWNEFTNTLAVTGTITATTINGTFNGSLNGSVTGNVTGNVSGNAGTVTNGVYTTGSYANPSWITSLSADKISGVVLTSGSYSNPTWITSLDGNKVTNVVREGGTYSNPNWLTSLDGSKITGNISGNAGTVTNGVYTSGSYSNPAWITSLAGSKISGDISGNAANVTGIVQPVKGGTGLNSYTAGDLLYASSVNTLASLAKGTTGYVLTAGASAPQYVAQSTLSVGSATTATTATNVAGGAAGSLVYQTGAATTTTLALGAVGSVLVAGASAPQYATAITAAVNPRVTTLTSATSITPNADTTDMVVMNMVGASGTLTINAPTGTPANGQRITLRIQSTLYQTFSWNSIYAGSADISLPIATSGSGLTDYIGFMYNSSANKWQIMGKNFGF